MLPDCGPIYGSIHYTKLSYRFLGRVPSSVKEEKLRASRQGQVYSVCDLCGWDESSCLSSCLDFCSMMEWGICKPNKSPKLLFVGLFFPNSQN